MDRGYLYAVAHVRGGGEGGRRWWLDGRLDRKRNTFTDFITVADALATDLRQVANLIQAWTDASSP